MSNNIYINNVGLKDEIEKLNSQFLIMKDVFEKIDSKNKIIPDYWETDTSEETTDELNNLSYSFKKHIEQNEKYISFLNNVVNSDYESVTNSEVNIIDDRFQ